MHSKVFISIFTAILLLSCQLAHSIQPLENSNITQINRFNISGDERWDYLTVDPKRHHLFLSRSNHVQVVDTDLKKVIGDIPDTEGIHGIAIADDLNIGFTSNGKDNSVTVFDLTTLNVIKTIKISGLNPDGILYEPKSKHILTFNGRSSNATVIDAVSLKEIITVNFSGKPEAAVSDNDGNIYVNIEDKNEIALIDVASNKVLKSFHLGNGIRPTGLAIDQKHNRLFSVCGNGKLEVLDSQTGKIISEVSIGSGPDAAAFDSNLGIVFSSNGEGTLSLIKEVDPEHFSLLQNVITQKGARTMAYDSINHRAYLVTSSFGVTPPASKEQPKPRPSIVPNSFVVLEVTINP